MTASGLASASSNAFRCVGVPCASRSNALASLDASAPSGRPAATRRSLAAACANAVASAASSGAGGDVERIERQVEQRRRVLDRRQLGRLVRGHEAVDAHHLSHLGQRTQPLRQHGRRSRVRRQHVDRVRRPVRIAGQIGERAHRRRIRIAQVERVEVEPHQRQQCDADEHRRNECPQHLPPVARQPSDPPVPCPQTRPRASARQAASA